MKSDSSIRVRGTNQSNYIDNRYWTMYKLPMFGCTDPSQVGQQPGLYAAVLPEQPPGGGAF